MDSKTRKKYEQYFLRNALCILSLMFIISSCKKDRITSSSGEHLKIAVITDIHYLDPSLLKSGAATGKALMDYMSRDPKMIPYGDPIFREVIEKLKAEHPDIVLVAGDITKDGEKISHLAVANLFQELEDEHMQVFVVPGNHDINNPFANRYEGDNAYPIASVSAEEFRQIYSNFGFSGAISRDPNSLSYISQPGPGLWILGIDDCKYNENKPDSDVTAGNITSKTMQWIQAQMKIAKRNNIVVLGLMHHNMIEHYAGQSVLDPDYVTDNWQANADTLRAWGMNIIFTGHYHANDIALRGDGSTRLYDIETGALIHTPVCYRIVDLNVKKKELDVTTKYITSISADIPGGLDFVTYSNIFFSTRLDGIFSYRLTQPPFLFTPSVAVSSAPTFRNAFIAHKDGDEKISPEEQARVNAFAQISPIGYQALMTLWTDLPPKDNTLNIKLTAP
ncbi:MAG TPA: metallophosphoesterase [Mucilaginibacter sp.]|jgi:predicted MPP superfamily phosphohydrolase